MVDRVGERFGDYRLKRLISDRGAFADVYEAEHVVDQTKAAIKVWKVQIEDRIFLNDVHAAVLDHPHIVKIWDFGIKGDIPYLVMPYAPYGSLKAQVLPLPLHSIVTYIQQITHALDYAHRRGIVHRDIKPDNILLGPQHEIWVGDFGIATPSFTRQDTLLGEPEKRLTGTPDYMAPEQWEDHVSPASDQYALGVMVYEWLCGERPFRGNLTALYHKHMYVSPPPLCDKISTISPAVEQAVMKALEKDPEKRFASVVEFAQTLDQAYQAEQSTVAPLGSRGSPLGTLLHSYRVDLLHIYSFSWMQNRPRLAIGYANGKIEAWDFPTGSLFSRQIEGQIEQLSWSPNGHCLACLSWSPNELTSKLQIWNAETGNCLASYAKAWKPLIWSPDSTCIAFSSYSSYEPRRRSDINDRNLTFQIWNIDPAQLISTLSAFRGSSGKLIPLACTSSYSPYRVQGYREMLQPAWSPDYMYIAFFPQFDSGNGWVIPVYEVATGNIKTAYPLIQKGQLERANISWSPDATHIASSTSYVKHEVDEFDVYDNDGQLVHLRKKWTSHSHEEHIWETATQSEITSWPFISTRAWSPDSACVAIPYEKQRERGQLVEIWEISTKRKLLAYEGHTEFIEALAWSPDNKYIASKSRYENIHIWDAHSAKCILVLESDFTEPTIEWSPDGTRLAILGHKNGQMQLLVWQVV